MTYRSFARRTKSEAPASQLQHEDGSCRSPTKNPGLYAADGRGRSSGSLNATRAGLAAGAARGRQVVIGEQLPRHFCLDSAGGSG